MNHSELSQAFQVDGELSACLLSAKVVAIQAQIPADSPLKT